MEPEFGTVDIYRESVFICRYQNTLVILVTFDGSKRLHLDVAADPFFGRGGRMLVANQIAEELKFELVVPITSIEEPEPVSSGANVILLEPYDEGVFYGSQSRGGAAVVSPIQIYLDLKKFGELGQKAADAIFDFVIRNLW